jgi:uncharacterized protein (TIGR02271 family)
MYQRTHIKEGMVVRSIDGEKLGKVFAIGDDSFQIEKGLFFPKDYLVRYAEVSDVRGGEIILTHGRESLQQLGAERYGTTSTAADTSGVPIGAPMGTASTSGSIAGDTTGLGLGAATSGLNSRTTDTSLNARANLGTERVVTGRTEDITVPLHKEELDILKRDTQAGEVRVRKDVVEEERVVDVPVRRERVRVERRDVVDRPAMSASFQEETVVVPLRAEEVEVQKRAMVSEEVIIHKDAVEEERRVAETVRREEVAIRSDGDVDGPRTLNLSGDVDDPSKKRY